MGGELDQRHYSNSLLYLLREANRLTRLVTYFKAPYSIVSEIEQQRYSNWLKTAGDILRSDNLRRVIFYFLDHGAATDDVLTHSLGLPPSSVAWARRRLAKLGLITRAMWVRAQQKGPRKVVWMLPDATAEQVSEAALLHQRLQSPKYRIAEEVAQTILEDYVMKRPTMEITYREIVIKVRELRIPFSTPDIADLTAQYLHEQGVRIWR